MKIGYPKGDNYKLVLASLQPCQRRFIERLSTCTDDELLVHLQVFTQWVWEKSDIICWASVLNRFDDIFSHYIETSRTYMKGESELEPESYFNQVELVKIALKTSIMIVENSTSKSIYNSLDLLIHLLDDVNLEVVYLSTRLLCVYFSSRNRRNSVMNDIPLISSRLSTFVTNPLPDRDMKILSSNSTEHTRVFNEAGDSEFVSSPLVLEYYLKCNQYWLSRDSHVELDAHTRDNPDHVTRIPIHDLLNIDLISQSESSTRHVNYNTNEQFMALVSKFVANTSENEMYLHLLKTFKHLVTKYKIEDHNHHVLRYKLLKTFSFYFVHLQRLLVNTRLSSLICMLLINTATYTQFLNYNPCFLLELTWFIKCHQHIDYSTMIISTELLSAMIYDGIQYKALSNLLGFGMPHGIFVKVLKSYLHHEHEGQPLPPLLKLRQTSPGSSPSRDPCQTDDYTAKDEKELCTMQNTGFVLENYSDDADWAVLAYNPDTRDQIVADEEKMRVLLQLLIVYYSIISYHGNCSALTSVNVLEALVRFIRCRNPIYTPVIIYVVQVLEALLDYNQTVSRLLRADLQLYHVFISRLQYDMYKIEKFVHFGNEEANSQPWPHGWLLPESNEPLPLRVYWLTFSESSARRFLFKTIIKDIYSVTRPYSGRAEINDYDVFAPTSTMVPVILTILKNPLRYGHGVYSSVITLILDTLGEDPVSQEEMHKLGIVPAFLSSISEETLKSEECLNVVPTAICDLFPHRSGQDYYKSMKYSFVLKLIDIVVKREFVLFDRFGEVAASIGISLDTVVRHHDTAHSLVVRRLVTVIYDLLLEALTFPPFTPVPVSKSSQETDEYLGQYRTNSPHITLDTLSQLDHISPGDFYADRIANLGKCLSTFLSFPQSVSYFNSCDGIKLLVQLCTVPCLPPMFIHIYSQHPLVLIIKYLTSQSPIPSIVQFHTISHEYLAHHMARGRLEPGRATTTSSVSTRSKSNRKTRGSALSRSISNLPKVIGNLLKEGTSRFTSGSRGSARGDATPAHSDAMDETPEGGASAALSGDKHLVRLHGTLQFLHLMHRENASLYETGCCGKHQLGVDLLNMSTCDMHRTISLALDVISAELPSMMQQFAESLIKLTQLLSKPATAPVNPQLSHEHPQLRAYKAYMAERKTQQSDVVFSPNDLFWSTQCAYAYSHLNTDQKTGLETKDGKHTKEYKTLYVGAGFDPCGPDLLEMELRRSTITAAKSLMFALNVSINKAVALTRNGNACLRLHVVRNANQIVEICVKLLEKATQMVRQGTSSRGADGAQAPSAHLPRVRYISDVLELVYRLVIDDRTNSLYPLTTALFSSRGGMALVAACFDHLFTLFFALVAAMAQAMNPELSVTDVFGEPVDLPSFENMADFLRELGAYDLAALRMLHVNLVNAIQICLSFFAKCTNPRTILNTDIDPDISRLVTFNDHTDLKQVGLFKSGVAHFTRSVARAAAAELLAQGNTHLEGESVLTGDVSKKPDGLQLDHENGAELCNLFNLFHKMISTFITSCWRWLGFMVSLAPRAPASSTASPFFFVPSKLATFLLKVHIYVLDYSLPARRQAMNLHLCNLKMTAATRPDQHSTTSTALNPLNRRRTRLLQNPPATSDSDGSDRGGQENQNIDSVRSYLSEMGFNERDINNAISHCGTSDITTLTDWLVNIGEFAPENMDLADYSQVSDDDDRNQRVLDHLKHSMLFSLQTQSDTPFETLTPPAASDDYYTRFGLRYVPEQVDYKALMESIFGTLRVHILGHILALCTAMPTFLPTGYDSIFKLHSFKIAFTLPCETKSRSYLPRQQAERYAGRNILSPNERFDLDFTILNLMTMITAQISATHRRLQSRALNVKTENLLSLFCPVIFVDEGEKQAALDQILGDFIAASCGSVGGSLWTGPMNSAEGVAKGNAQGVSEELEMEYNSELALEHERLLSLFYLLSHLMAGKESFTHLAVKIRDENNRPVNMLQSILEVVDLFLSLRSHCFSKGVLTLSSLGINRKFGLPLHVAEWCLSGEFDSWFTKRSGTAKFTFRTLKYGLYATGCTPQIASPPPFFKCALICIDEIVKSSIIDAVLLHTPHLKGTSSSPKSDRETPRSSAASKGGSTPRSHNRPHTRSYAQPALERPERESPSKAKDAFRQYREHEIHDAVQERLLYACMKVLDLFPGLDGEVSFSLLSILSVLTEVHRNAEKLTRYRSLTGKHNLDFLRLLLGMPRSASCAQALRIVSNIILRVMEDHNVLRPSIKNTLLILLLQGPISFTLFMEKMQPFNRKCPMLFFQVFESMCVITVDEALYPAPEGAGESATSETSSSPHRSPAEALNYNVKDLVVALKSDKMVRDLVPQEGLDLAMCQADDFKVDHRRSFQITRTIAEYLQLSCNLHGITQTPESPEKTYPLCFTMSNFFFLMNVINFSFPLPLTYPEAAPAASGPAQRELQIRTFPFKPDRLDRHNVRSVLVHVTRNLFNMICCLVCPPNVDAHMLSTGTKAGASAKSDEPAHEPEQLQKMIIDSLEGYTNTLMVFCTFSVEATACVIEEVTETLHQLSTMNVRDSGPFLMPLAVCTLCNLLNHLLELKFYTTVDLHDVFARLKKSLCVILAKLDLFKLDTRVVCGSITRVLVLLTNSTSGARQQPQSDEPKETAVVVELEDSVTDDSDSEGDRMEMDTEDHYSEEGDFSEEGEYTGDGQYTEEGEFSEDGYSEDAEEEGEEMIIDVSSTDSNESSDMENHMDDASEDDGNVDMVLPHEVEEDYHSNQYTDTVSSSSMEDVEEEEEDEGPRIRVAGEIDELSRTENSQIIDTTTNISIPEENESEYSVSLSDPEEVPEEHSEALVPLETDLGYAAQRTPSRSNNGNRTIHIEIQFANQNGLRHANTQRIANEPVPNNRTAANQRSGFMSSWSRLLNYGSDSRQPNAEGSAAGRSDQQDQLEAEIMEYESWLRARDTEIKNPLLPQFKKVHSVDLPDPLVQFILRKMKVLRVKRTSSSMENEPQEDKDDVEVEVVERYQEREPEDDEEVEVVERYEGETATSSSNDISIDTLDEVCNQLINVATNQMETLEEINNITNQLVTTIANHPSEEGDHTGTVEPSAGAQGSAGAAESANTAPENTAGAQDEGRMELDSQGRYYNRGLDIIANALGITYAELFGLANMDPGVIAEIPAEMREEIISQQLNTINVDSVATLRQSRSGSSPSFTGELPSRSELQYLESLPRSLRLDVTRAIYGENSAEANEINATIDLEGDNTSLVAALGPFFRGESFNSVNEFLNNITTELQNAERAVATGATVRSFPRLFENLRPRNAAQPEGQAPATQPPRTVQPATTGNVARPLLLPILNNLSRNEANRIELSRSDFDRIFSRNANRTEGEDGRNGLTLGFIIGEVRGQNGMGRRLNTRSRIGRRLTGGLNRRNDLMRDVFLLSGRNLRMSRLNDAMDAPSRPRQIDQMSIGGNMNDLGMTGNDEADDRNSNFDSRILQSIPQILNTLEPGLGDLMPQRLTSNEATDAPPQSSENFIDDLAAMIPTSHCSPHLTRSRLSFEGRLNASGEPARPAPGPEDSAGDSMDLVATAADVEAGRELAEGGEPPKKGDSKKSLIVSSQGCGAEIDFNGLVGVCKMFFLPNEINKRVFFKLLYNIAQGPSLPHLMRMFLYMLRESILNVDVEYECTDVDETFFSSCPSFLPGAHNAHQAYYSHIFAMRSSSSARRPPFDPQDKTQQANSIKQVFESTTRLEYENFCYMCSERVLEQLRSLFIALPDTLASFSRPLNQLEDPAAHELKRKKKRTDAVSFYPVDFFLCATATNLFQSSTKHMNHLLMVIHNLLVYKPERRKLDGYTLDGYDSYEPAQRAPGAQEHAERPEPSPEPDSDVHSHIVSSMSEQALGVFLKIYTSYRCQSTWLLFCNTKDASSQAQLEVIAQFLAVAYKAKHGEFVHRYMLQKFALVASLLSEHLGTLLATDLSPLTVPSRPGEAGSCFKLDSRTEPLMFTLLRMTQLMSETIMNVYGPDSAERAEHLAVLHRFFADLPLDTLWSRLDESLTRLTEVSLVRNFVGDFYKELHIENSHYFDIARSLIPLIEVFLSIAQLHMAFEYNVTDMHFDRVLANVNYDQAFSAATTPNAASPVFSPMLRPFPRQDSNPQPFVEHATDGGSTSFVPVSPRNGTPVATASGPSESGMALQSSRSLRDDEDETLIDISSNHLLCLNFVEKHKRLLNLFIKQSPALLNNAFLPLVKLVPMCLSFDVKRQYFRQKLREGRMGLRIDPIKINVRRQHVFLDSYHQLRLKTSDEMKGKLSVSFGGEEGVDAGGLTREWYTILSKEMFNPNYALFTREGRKQEFNHPNPLSAINPDHLNYFRFIGRVIGKALYDGHHMEAYFCRSFYKHMLGTRITPYDAESVDPQFYNNLISIRNSTLEQLGLELYFSTEIDEFGKVKVIDLIPNGRNILVTDENKHRYIQLLCKHKVTNGIREQLDAFMEGFRELISPELISIFDDRELELLISGIPIIDLANMRQNVEYVNYSEESPQICWLWDILGEFDQSHLAAFLQFVTGTSRVPIGGFKNLMGMRGPQRISIHKTFGEDRLPTAHTCFNQLDLPAYSSREMLKSKLLQAILEGKEGFGFI